VEPANGKAKETQRTAQVACALLGLLTVAAFILFPLKQGLFDPGTPFYTNALDEASYLQYDYASLITTIAGPARLSEYLVVWGHTLGLSGGIQNLLSDILFPIFFLFVLLRIGRSAGVKADTFSVALFLFPCLFLTANPLIDWLAQLIQRTELLQWVTAPMTPSPPWIRTPEPQLSLCILLCVLWWQVARRIYAPVLLVTPFLYPFIGLPCAFIFLALILDTYIASKISVYSLRVFTAALGSFVLIGSALGILYSSGWLGGATGYLVPSHVPILSVSALINFVLLYFCRKNTPLWIWIVALAPLAVVNTQLLSGFFIQPNNFEQYSGVLSSALILWYVTHGTKSFLFFLILSVAFSLLSAFKIYDQNAQSVGRVLLTPELMHALQSTTSTVVAEDFRTATTLDLIFPRQGLTALSYTRFYKSLPERTYQEFLCLKKDLQRFGALPSELEKTVEIAEKNFLAGDQNAPLTTLNRYHFLIPARSGNISECASRRAEDFHFIR
jgi:hypothetical protein